MPPFVLNADKPAPFDVVQRAAREHGVREVIVGYSMGKDSIATLDLCLKHFERVVPYFMFIIPGLSYQQDYIRFTERRTGVSVVQVPHWVLSHQYRSNHFRYHTTSAAKVRKVVQFDIDAGLRLDHKIRWLANGDKACDSVQRNARLKKCRGIEQQYAKLFPLTYWNHGNVFSYLRAQNIPLPPAYRYGRIVSKKKTSGRGNLGDSMMYHNIKLIHDHFPEDWKLVKRYYPLAEMQLVRYEHEHNITVEHETDEGTATDG